MRKAYITLLTLMIFFASNGQEKTNGFVQISGTVKDSATNQPLANATVRLSGIQNPRNNYGAGTDNAGHFTIDKIIPGDYELSVEFVGYTTHRIKNISIDGSNGERELPLIYLQSTSKTLGNVVVTGTKSLIENKIDRVVYNVEKDVTSQTGMATDVLRKIPQVSVDINGNVELLGNPSIRFLINGKPSVIFGNSVADALQSIPASQIQSIEVISSPGAKYDATGTGGVINIILKKNKARGFSGVANLTAGTRQENTSLNLNFKKDNLGITGYFSGNALMPVQTNSTLDRQSIDTVSGDTYYLHQNGHNDFTRNGYRTGLGIDWDLTPKDNLSFSFGYDEFGNKNNGRINQQNTISDQNGAEFFKEESNRTVATRFRVHSVELSADYRKKFKRERKELSFSAQYSTDDNHTSYLQMQRYLVSDSVFAGSSSANPGKDHLATFMFDYATPLSKTFLLEMGLKAEIESLISNANVYTFNPSGYEFVFDDKQSYTSDFQRKVYAGYVSGTAKFAKWLDVIAGVRWEHTVNNATYSNAHAVTIPDYDNIGPSITMAHTFQNQQTLKFSYSYRLERPEYRDLNPFINLADPHNIVTGNPNIKPEIGNDFQLGYNYNFGKDNNINIILLYNYNSPDIKSYTTFYPKYQVGDSIYENVNLTQRDNIASEHRFGLNLSGSFTAASKLTIRPGVQLYQRTTNNIHADPTKVSGFEYRATLNANCQFNHGLIAEAFGNYRSGIKWQGRQAAFSSYSIAVKQLLFKGKGSIGLVAVNAFSKYLTQRATQLGTGFTAATTLQIPYRSFGINFMYKFGKIKVKQKDDDFLSKPPIEN